MFEKQWFLHTVFRDDVRLALQGNTKCWSSKVMAALRVLGVPLHLDDGDLDARVSSVVAQTLDVESTCELMSKWLQPAMVGLDADPRACASQHATLCTHLRWFLPADTDRAAHVSCYDIQPGLHRLLMRFRLGCADIAVNSGRFIQTPRDQRKCRACNQDAVEDERHVVFECDAYASLRQMSKYSFVIEACGDMAKLFGDDSIQRLLAEFVWRCTGVRRQLLDGSGRQHVRSIVRRCVRRCVHRT